MLIAEIGPFIFWDNEGFGDTWECRSKVPGTSFDSWEICHDGLKDFFEIDTSLNLWVHILEEPTKDSVEVDWKMGVMMVDGEMTPLYPEWMYTDLFTPPYYVEIWQDDEQVEKTNETD